MDAVALRLLGPVELCVDGDPVDLGGPRRRSLLAYLVMHRGSAVPADRIVADLWGADADAAGARRSLQTYVSSLRGLLPRGPGGLRITHRAGAYLVESTGAWIDLDDFQRGAERAIGQDDAAAASQALELWRGRPLSDLPDDDWSAPAVTALQETYRRVLLVHLDALLAQQRCAQVLAAVGEAVVAAPFDEQLRERRMLALYRSGRQAEALAEFAEFEATLREELGLEPGRDLSRLQRRMLLHAPDLAEPSAPLHVVPASVSRFVGRGSELVHLDELAREHRLVTISGPGGVGKTRMAVELAHSWRGRLSAGVYFVDLAPLTEPARIPGEIAGRLGAGRSAGNSLDHLGTHLEEAEALLVLDNAEHMRDDVAVVVRTLLERAPGLRILVTSRVALGLVGEVVWQLPPLEVPPEGDGASRLAERDAVVLFAQRAREVRPAFRLGPTNLSTVGRICRRLDGLPLAIEIAVSRLRSMAVSDIEARLARDLGSLHSVDPTITDRHRTLSAVLAWSTDRIPPDTARVFARLSVVPGSFDLTAAAAICRSTEADVADHLDVLVEHSLLGSDQSGPSSRYRMLEVVRDHAAEMLVRSGEADDAHHALLEWGLDVVRRVGAGSRGTDPSWVAGLIADRAALRAALGAGLAHDPRAGLRLATGLVRFWWANAGDPDAPASQSMPTLHEGIDWLERLLAAADADARTRAAAQVALGFLREVVGEHASAREVLVEAREAMDAAGDTRLAGWAALYLGNVAWGEGSSEAATFYREANQRLTAARDLEGQGMTAVLEFSYHLRTNGPAAAAAALERVLQHTRSGAPGGVPAYRAGVLALDALARGAPEEARGPLLLAMDETRSATDPVTSSILLGICAWYAAVAGHVPTAALLLAVSEAVEERNGLVFKQAEFSREFARDVLGSALTPQVEATARRDAKGRRVGDAIAALRDLIEPTPGPAHPGAGSAVKVRS